MLDWVHELEGYVVVSDLVAVLEEYVVVLDLVPELEGQVMGLGLVLQLGEVHIVQPLALVVPEGLALGGRYCSFHRFMCCRQFWCRWSFICYCCFCVHRLSSAPITLIQYV